jgi:hypothetical protein
VPCRSKSDFISRVLPFVISVRPTPRAALNELAANGMMIPQCGLSTPRVNQDMVEKSMAFCLPMRRGSQHL